MNIGKRQTTFVYIYIGFGGKSCILAWSLLASHLHSLMLLVFFKTATFLPKLPFIKPSRVLTKPSLKSHVGLTHSSSVFRTVKRRLITLWKYHWDVQKDHLCLTATRNPSGEVITLTRGCALQSQLIHINWAAGAVWMQAANYIHYWNTEFGISHKATREDL